MLLTKDLFISYGRRESLGFVGRLHQQLRLAGYEVWFDKVNIPDGEDYAERIHHGIETAHNFAYIMAPRCLISPYCLMELEYARLLGKRVIPLNQMVIFQTDSCELSAGDQAALHRFYMLHSVSDPDLNTTQAVLNRSLALIGRTDWLDAKEYLSTEDCIELATWAQGYENHWHKHDNLEYLKTFEFPVFGKNIDSLASIIERMQIVLERHKQYVQQHTDILLETLTWERHQRLTRHLLVGKERLQAEDWLLTDFVAGEQPPCQPTDLQCEFICESRKNSFNMMTHAFICYDVADKAIRNEVVRLLARHAITTWRHDYDIQEGSDFARAIEYGIETADNFLYFLSPYITHSDYCRKELEHALQYHKRIIPLLIVPTPEQEISEPIRALQYLDFTQGIDIDALLKIMLHDQAYYEQHKVLLARALKWQQENHKPAFLLRGYNLSSALIWLRLNQDRLEHSPTEHHHALITTSEAAKGQLGTEVFISYSRKDSDFARQLNLALQAAGKTTWFDQESISSGVDFEREIFKGIDGANNFIFIISPDAVESPYCEREVNYASGQCKRFISLLWRTTAPATMPPALQAINWIDFQNMPFENVFPELIQTIDLDREHAHQHTVLQQRASDWVDNDRSKDFLLNNTACENAERWQAAAGAKTKQPVPTPLQQEFIQASRNAIAAARKAEHRRRNIILTSVTAGLIIAIILSIFSWLKMREAKDKTTEVLKTQSLFLSILSNQETDEGSATNGILMALEGLPKNHDRPYVMQAGDKLYKAVLNYTEKMSESQILIGNKVVWSPDGKTLATIDTEGEYVYLWDSHGQLLHALIGHEDNVLNVHFSPDGQMLATTSDDKTVRLWAVNSGKLLHTLAGHEGGVNNAVFSPDGQTLATTSDDKTARLWAVSSGQVLHTLTGHQGKVVSVVFSPDSQMLATASNDKTARLWSVNSGQPLQILTGHQDKVVSVVFSPDGQTLATASWDKTARLWAVNNGQSLQILTGHEGYIYDAVFSPDGLTLATASRDRTVRLWAVKNGRVLQTLAEHNNSVLSVVFSPDGQKLATASWDKTARLWAVNSGQVLQTLMGHEDRVLSVAFSLDGQTLTTASADKTVRLWTVNDSQRSHILMGHKGYVHNAVFSYDGQTLATASDDNTARLWAVNSGKLLHTLTGHNSGVVGVHFSPDSQTLATASNDKTARLWAVNSGKLLHTLAGHKDGVHSAVFSPDGQTLATTSDDKTAQLWAVNSGQLLQVLTGHEGSVYDAAFSPDGQMLATASTDSIVRLWAVNSGQLLRTLTGHEDGVYNVVFSPDGQTLVTTSDDKTTRLWAVNSGKLLHILKEHEDVVWNAVFSPDGKTLATASLDKTARLWAVNSGQLLHTLTGHENIVWSVVFSPDGQTLATGSGDNTVRLWAVNNGELLRTLTGHKDDVRDVVFSPDGQTLATASWDKTVRLWWSFNTTTPELIDHANSLVPRCLTPTQRQEFFLPPSMADNLLEQGKKLAKNGEIPAAITQFKQAKALALCFKFNPEAQAKQLAAQARVDQGKTWAKEGKISAAVAEFQQALAIDSRFKLDNPEHYAQQLAFRTFMLTVEKLARKGEIDAALTEFQTAQQLNVDLKDSVAQWAILCRYGSIYGQAAKVMVICEKAVALAPQEWNVRDNRALARALTGNIPGAIADFQFAIEKSGDNEFRKQRQGWVEALQRGEKPFTKEVLKKWRSS